MSVCSKFRVVRWFFPLVLSAVALAQPLAANHTMPRESTGAVVEKTRETDSEAKPARVPFCLPGEKRVCTLGPPPVCHCE
jgi:hypothetical protein